MGHVFVPREDNNEISISVQRTQLQNRSLSGWPRTNVWETNPSLSREEWGTWHAIHALPQQHAPGSQELPSSIDSPYRLTCGSPSYLIYLGKRYLRVATAKSSPPETIQEQQDLIHSSNQATVQPQDNSRSLVNKTATYNAFTQQQGISSDELQNQNWRHHKLSVPTILIPGGGGHKCQHMKFPSAKQNWKEWQHGHSECCLSSYGTRATITCRRNLRTHYSRLQTRLKTKARQRSCNHEWVQNL